MKRANAMKKTLLMAAALLVVPGTLTLASAEPSLETLLDQARSEAYAVPPANSILRAQEGFRQWLAADKRSERERDFKDLDYESIALSQSDIVVLTEEEGARRGRGLFAARVAGGSPLLIQAPHQYFDLRTGTLARQLFLESDAMAAAWNTTHRYESDDTDLVHIADSYLHALSRAFADVHPEGRILQLHGYSRAKRDSRAGREAQAILSDGTSYPPKALVQLTACLSDRLAIRALLYPRDVRELGATTNTLAADLRRRNFDGFVHLELDADLRKRLTRDAGARHTLIQCVTETTP
ncbi:hypothetical protein GLV89_08280 [Halomonas alkaliantarctica]|nr:hypothetical protein [Halomonas alkaliantarctica]